MWASRERGVTSTLVPWTSFHEDRNTALFVFGQEVRCRVVDGCYVCKVALRIFLTLEEFIPSGRLCESDGGGVDEVV